MEGVGFGVEALGFRVAIKVMVLYLLSAGFCVSAY